MATGPHFFVDVDASEDSAVVEGEEARHLERVLRVRPGDPVSVSDGRGTIWQGTVDQVGREGVRVALGDRVAVPAETPALTVVHALPKQRKLDEVVQKLTELGVGEIRPVMSARSQVVLEGPRAHKAVARWRAVAHAAAKQSRRAWLPTICAVGTWDGAFGAPSCGVVCWEESRRPLREVLDAWPDCREVIVGIGPEGGLTPDEVRAAALPDASMGRTILRTETAALVAVSAIRYHLGLMT